MTFKEVSAQLAQAASFFCKPGTERVEALTSRLGMPQNAYPVVHVTGTNGKGSTSLMIASVLSASGYRTGQFSSPYLTCPTECIRIDGVPLTKRRFTQIAAQVLDAARTLDDPPTEFELLTVMAYLAFREAKVALAVVEVGMGGRTDATNIIDAPLLSVITGVSLEHTAYLGTTVSQIAREKAGIVKAGCPVLFGGSDGEAYQVIATHARSLGAPVYRTAPEKITLLDATPNGSRFKYRAPTVYPMPLPGLYQVSNAACALDALAILRAKLPKIREESIREGFLGLRWQGRFECLCQDPPVYFDGAHNPDGIAAAEKTIRAYFKDGVILVSGILADKDYATVVRILSPHLHAAYTVTPKNPRALDAATYAHAFREAGVPATPCATVRKALASAMTMAKEKGLPVLCIGSLYLYDSIKRCM